MLVVINNTYNESVIPKNEFMINLGSQIIMITPTNAIFR